MISVIRRGYRNLALDKKICLSDALACMFGCMPMRTDRKSVTPTKIEFGSDERYHTGDNYCCLSGEGEDMAFLHRALAIFLLLQDGRTGERNGLNLDMEAQRKVRRLFNTHVKGKIKDTERHKKLMHYACAVSLNIDNNITPEEAEEIAKSVGQEVFYAFIQIAFEGGHALAKVRAILKF